jgi:hypothetical protein
VIYAILLGWPGGGREIHLGAFAVDSLPAPLEIPSVSLLGSGAEIDWNLAAEGLTLITPAEAPDQMALVFKIETRKTP